METNIPTQDISRSEGGMVLDLNQMVRKIVKKRLGELEDTIVSFAVEAIRDVLRSKQTTYNQNQNSTTNATNVTDYTNNLVFYEDVEVEVDDENDTEEVIAIPFEYNQVEYYVTLHKEYKVAYAKILCEDGEFEIGDEVIGFVDDSHCLWVPNKLSDGTTISFVKDGETTSKVPRKIDKITLNGEQMVVPDWSKK